MELTQSVLKKFLQTPTNRFGESDELVGTLFYLVSHEASSFVNGVVIPVDGGFQRFRVCKYPNSIIYSSQVFKVRNETLENAVGEFNVSIIKI